MLLFCGWPTTQVLDDDQEYALGVLELPLCQILPYADLTLEQRFQLDHSGLDSLISMRLVLRVNLFPGPPGEAGGRALALEQGRLLEDGFVLLTIFGLSAIISSNIASPILLMLPSRTPSMPDLLISSMSRPDLIFIFYIFLCLGATF